MISKWQQRVLNQMALIEPRSGATDEENFFLDAYYKGSEPLLFETPRSGIHDFGLDEVAQAIGVNTLVQIQRGRRSNPNYETESPSHRYDTSFGMFMAEMSAENANDVYITAQNAGANAEATRGLLRYATPLPEMLTQEPERGFMWLGHQTVTPLHHDETNNLMYQVFGTKVCVLVPPDQREKLSPAAGVHTRIGWLTDEMIEARAIRGVRKYFLEPGHALFVPIGWYHCVLATSTSMTITYTNFVWPNFWGRVTDRTYESLGSDSHA